jgi:hypothetical protein
VNARREKKEEVRAVANFIAVAYDEVNREVENLNRMVATS